MLAAPNAKAMTQGYAQTNTCPLHAAPGGTHTHAIPVCMHRYRRRASV